MVKRDVSNRSKDRVSNESMSSTITIKESVDNWDGDTERLKQEIAYYQNLEAKVINQLTKELNACLALVRIRPNKLCNLDKTYLRAKVSLIISKLDASDLAEKQITKMQGQIQSKTIHLQ